MCEAAATTSQGYLPGVIFLVKQCYTMWEIRLYNPPRLLTRFLIVA